MFWRKDNRHRRPTPPPSPRPRSAPRPAPLDAASEAARLSASTGGQPVVIARERRGGGFKLPGL
jgi:hypothetical protein